MMSKQLQQSIDFVQKLSLAEQMELVKAILNNLYKIAQPFDELKQIETISQLLLEVFYKIDRTKIDQSSLSASFWQPKTLQQHIQEQQVQPITNLDSLVADFWPEDQSADDFINPKDITLTRPPSIPPAGGEVRFSPQRGEVEGGRSNRQDFRNVDGLVIITELQ